MWYTPNSIHNYSHWFVQNDEPIYFETKPNRWVNLYTALYNIPTGWFCATHKAYFQLHAPLRTPRFPSSNPISGSSMAHLESQSGLMFQQRQGSWCFNKHHSFLLLLSGGEFSHNSTTPSEVLRGLLKGGLCCSSSLGAPQVHKPLDRRVRVKQAGGQPQTCLVDTSKCLNYFRFHLAHSNFPLGTWAPHHRLGFFPSFSTHDHASDDSPPACSVFVGPWSQRNPQDSPAQNVTINSPSTSRIFGQNKLVLTCSNPIASWPKPPSTAHNWAPGGGESHLLHL